MEVLPRMKYLPAVTAALPENVAKVNGAGIENPISTYRSKDLQIRFDYGARVHPGCASSPCDLTDVEVGGLPGRLAESRSEGGSRRLVYFVPLVSGGHRLMNDPLAGAGLLLSITCRSQTCAAGDRVVQSVRFSVSSAQS